MAYTHLTIFEVCFIEGYTRLFFSIRYIAQNLHRSPETVARVYRFIREGHTSADYMERYFRNKWKCGRKKILLDPVEEALMYAKLQEGWSPDVIIGRLPNDFPCNSRTLYRRFKDGTYDAKILPMKGKRKPNGHVERRGKQAFRRHISERIEDYPYFYQEFGHWEGDTIIGKNGQDRLLTLVERKSKSVVVLRVASGKAGDIEAALHKWLSGLPKGLVKSITFDCGKEFSNWKEICNEHDISIYFADPGCPSQRGLNENTNGILRRNGLPKHMDFSRLPLEYIPKIIYERNSIPRKSLGYRTPLEVFQEELKKNGLRCLA